ncbi:MAG: 6-phosphogluconolactonase [Pyrinomonas methylaliphatogenes]|jgi:6-phosphogluconolactonase|uniref:6-phosphogluconolactonase n=2 Tax=Pyrinomonas methylaliphatogenes TaxID=454194 RepID=A0A0B6X0U1_9BACT|nr:6-phosphogluconolactonase [Pyrinomonas methylaliphatogenes]CDM66020.1 6-phosphogluconolactonase [Pyrinomonas methylaliphatogenes]
MTWKMNGRPIEIHPDLQAASRRAAELFVEIARQSIKRDERFDLALSGGSTPRLLYTLLGSEFSSEIDWNRTHLFWADERCVPPDDEESNYRMVHETLLARAPIPISNVHRMRGEEDPNRAAAEYEALLRAHFRGLPRFSLILLGMGADGHTASLFPYSPALDERERLTIATYVEKLKAMRLTLTLRSINNAAHVIFLVAGAEKAPALRAVFDEKTDARSIPAKLVAPTDGDLLWVVDRAAASLLAE